jgi:D-Tyr-tRNAtyr deacylase
LPTILLDKIVNLRIFEDDGGRRKMKPCPSSTPGGSSSSSPSSPLLADCRKGRSALLRRRRANRRRARRLYDHFFVAAAERRLGRVAAGCVFQAMMKVTLTERRPVTIILEMRKGKGKRHDGTRRIRGGIPPVPDPGGTGKALWHFRGAEMFRKEIVDLFYEHLRFDESSGKYVNSNWRNDRCFNEVDDTPYVVGPCYRNGMPGGAGRSPSTSS